MILRKLRASFGKLHGELELHEGMNVLCLPNEAGKSTWTAFLLAMLYGIETAERPNSSNQGLPAKERYKPWDGSAMEGSIDLVWNDRAITIERTTARRVPMGQFRAYETAGGAPVPELTAESCGRLLCGVERSVFERTAFIRQAGLSVSGDPALEKRLGALVTTGEEGGRSASELEKELRSLKNRLSGRAGRIPQLTSRLEQVRAKLRTLHRAQDEAMELAARLDAASAEELRLEALQQRIVRARNAQRWQTLNAMRAKYEAQAYLCHRLQETVRAIPDEATLHTMQRRLELAEQTLQTARMEEAFAPPLPSAPVPPACFADLDAAQATEQVAHDCAQYTELTQLRPSRFLLPLLLGAALLCGGAALLFWYRLPGVLTAAAGSALLLGTFFLRSRSAAHVREQKRRATLIPARYGVKSIEAVQPVLDRYIAERADYAQAVAELKEQQMQRSAAVQSAQAALQAAMDEVRAFSSGCQTAEDCRQALTAALRAHAELAAEQRNLDNMSTQLQSAQQLLSDVPADEPDAEALAQDPAQVAYDYRAAAEKRRRLENQLAECRGAIHATGNSVELAAEEEVLLAALTQAQESLAALELLSGALHHADEALRSRFSPQITAQTGAILSALTDGRYPNVLLSPDMRLSVREADGMLMRPAAAMSCGAADQMYLALRLAMCRSLLPADTPLVLDDALVNFDEPRTAAALRLLCQEAKQRQIILFSCRPLPQEKEE